MHRCSEAGCGHSDENHGPNGCTVCGCRAIVHLPVDPAQQKWLKSQDALQKMLEPGTEIAVMGSKLFGPTGAVLRITGVTEEAGTIRYTAVPVSGSFMGVPYGQGQEDEQLQGREEGDEHGDEEGAAADRLERAHPQERETLTFTLGGNTP